MSSLFVVIIHDETEHNIREKERREVCIDALTAARRVFVQVEEEEEEEFIFCAEEEEEDFVNKFNRTAFLFFSSSIFFSSSSFCFFLSALISCIAFTFDLFLFPSSACFSLTDLSIIFAIRVAVSSFCPNKSTPIIV